MEDHRGPGVRVDLEKLEQHAKELFLHRFVECVRKTRGEYGRYLVLRRGDELAIRAADDGSGDALDQVVVDLELD